MHLAPSPPIPSASERPAPPGRARSEPTQESGFGDVLRGTEGGPAAQRDPAGDPGARGAGEASDEAPSEGSERSASDAAVPPTAAPVAPVATEGDVPAVAAIDATAGAPDLDPLLGDALPAQAQAARPDPRSALPARAGLPSTAPTPGAPTPAANGQPTAEAPPVLPADGASPDLDGSPREPAAPALLRAPTPSPAPPAAGPPSPPSPPIPDPGPQERLAADVLRQVRVALDPARRSVTVRLDPRELGSISIRLDLGVGRVRAVLRAETPQALELLERHLPELRAALAAQGLEGEEFDLGLAEQRDPRGGRALDERRPSTSRAEREDEPLETLELRPWNDGSALDTYA